LASSLEEIIRMSTIIENLLLLSKADLGQYEFRVEDVPLHNLVKELYEDSEILAEQKKIKVNLQTIDEVNLRGDKVRLRQLLLNLIDNAIKYTPEEGTVSLSLEKQNGYAQLIVQDTGIGIPQQEIPKIFDRFYRVDKARTRELGGSGLGLSITKWIAELHKGYIEVESEVNKGSKFRVMLPISDS